MRETCGCGAEVRTMFYRRVLVWREVHRHDSEPCQRESDIAGQVEIGFQRVEEYDNGENSHPVINA